MKNRLFEFLQGFGVWTTLAIIPIGICIASGFIQLRVAGSAQQSPYLLTDVREYPRFIAEKQLEMEAPRRAYVEAIKRCPENGVAGQGVECAERLPERDAVRKLEILTERAKLELEMRKCR